MKKLVYLLVLSLCINGFAGVCSPWAQSASAASKTEAKVQGESAKKGKKDKTGGDGKSEKRQKSDEKSAKDEKKSAGKQKKTDAAKEKEYPLDLAQNNLVTLGDIIRYAKLGIKMKDVRAIELENRKDKKYIAWEPDGENEGDYIFTVLKDFKELRLRIETKKASRLLVLMNGSKDGVPGEAPEGADAIKPAEEEQETPAEQTQETAAEELTALLDEMPEQIPGDAPEGAPMRSEVPEAQEQTEVWNDVAGIDVSGIDTFGADAGDGIVIEGEALPATAEAAESSAGDETPGADAQGEAVEGVNGTPEGQDGTVEEKQEIPEQQDQGAESRQDQGAEGQQDGPVDQGESPEGRQETPERQQETPEGRQETPEGRQETPEGQQETPEGQQETPEGRQETPEGQQETHEGQQETPEGQQQTPGEGGEQPEAEDGASIPADAEAWFKRGTELHWGTLAEVVGQLTGGETVFIQANRLLLLREAPLQLLSTVTLLPDGDAFMGSYSVCLSTDNPALVSEPVMRKTEELAALGDTADLYIWVRLNEEETPGEEKPGEDDELTLEVSVTGLEPEGWSRTQPRFTLSGIPEGREWSYAAIIYDERFVPIASNMFVPDEQGVYTVRFAMLNELGDIVAASGQYTLQLDWTAPEMSIEPDEETSYTLHIFATDNASGLDAVSVDGGRSWQPVDDSGYTVTEDGEKTFEAGSIQVRDAAGNVCASEEDYTVEEVEGEEEGGEEGGGGGGGGGGSGNGTPALPHSSGDGEEGAEYDSLLLELPDEPMRQLTVGGEPMALTLQLASAQAAGAPVGSNQPFTARLCTWRDASAGDAPNTLLLDAELADDIGDVFTYEWHFNGEVYRMLANSGIRYVALKVADAVAAFPTEGFTGGTRYTELKMQGVSTRKFEYTLSMKLNLDPSHVSTMTQSDFSQECDLSIYTEVEDTHYELSDSPRSMMYYYNVVLGPEGMMDRPFGEYGANA